MKQEAKTQAAERRKLEKTFRRAKKSAKKMKGVDNPAVEVDEHKDANVEVCFIFNFLSIRPSKLWGFWKTVKF